MPEEVAHIKIPYIPKSTCAQGKMAAKPEVEIADSPGPSGSLPPLTIVPILKLLKTYTYIVPTFPALCVRLRHMKYQMQMEEDGSVGVFDGFIRECPALDRVYPAEALTTGYPDSFFVEVFTRHPKSLSLSLLKTTATHFSTGNGI